MTTPEQFDAATAKIDEKHDRLSKAGKDLNAAKRDKKIAGEIVDFRKLWMDTKRLLEAEKQKRLAAEKRADELQSQLEGYIEKAAAAAS